MGTIKTSFGKQTKEKLKKGAKTVYNMVSCTLGPYGRNILFKDEYGVTRSTKDGVSVAKMITQLEDPIEDFGAQLIKQAAIKTLEKGGDGTTTSTVLAYAMVNEILNNVGFKVNVTELKKGIELAVKHVKEKLENSSKEIDNEEQIKQIATLSANGDDEIGNLVTAALNKVGRDGIVTVEESRNGETSLEVVEGIQFDRGYRSPYFVTDNNTMSTTLNDPYILICNDSISQIKDMLPLLEKISSENKSLLIIADDVDGEALATLILNKSRGILKVCPVKAPDFGDRRTLVLEDIATLTGATVVSKQKGNNFSNFDMEWLGNARVVTVDKDTTTIIDGKGKEDQIKQRIEELKTQLEKTNLSPYEVEKLQERLAKLIGGVAVINVGGINEIDIKEKKDRVDDALQATKAALDEGILPGAGTSLIQAAKTLNQLKPKNKDIELGINIVKEACSVPYKQIIYNSGHNYESWINPKNNQVPDLMNNKFVDAYSSGIIDSTKIVKTALESAMGAAITMLLTEGVIYNNPEDKKKDDNFGNQDFGF